jgi:hypothetical protein
MMKRINSLARRFALVAGFALVAAGLGSCSGGNVGLPPLRVVAFNFAPGFAGVSLNAPLEITFSAPVEPSTVNQDSIRIFTTTTTTEQPDPGAPAIGTFVTMGNVVRFLPVLPQVGDLSDAGLRIGFTYTIQIPASPDVIEPVRTIEGKPNVVSYAEFFTTLNQTVLPAPSDIEAEPNLNTLQVFFIDEGIENGADPCPRSGLAPADQDSPQVIRTDPQEGESGFGTITGIQAGLGTAFVRLDPITVDFSEPIGPWRIRPQNISIRNTNLGGETFDLFFFFRQDRALTRLQITVFDADSAFDQASVPQGRYVLSLTQFTDLAGNSLVNSSTCLADGTFDLSFSTVSSPTLPTDLTLTFQDDDGDGFVDVGGLATGNNNPNVFPVHVTPMLGGFAIDHVIPSSPSEAKSSANWGDTAFWTGAEMRYDNGFDLGGAHKPIPDALRLRGSGSRAATAILSPLAGRATGPSDPLGSTAGSVNSPEGGKVDFVLTGSQSAALFTGDATTGPIVYHYNSFSMTEDLSTGARPLLTHRKLSPGDSLFPLIIFVEDNAVITGDIIVDGADAGHGFNGANDGTTSYTPGGAGGLGGPGGGNGGRGGAADFTGDLTDPEKHNGQTGEVCANVIGPLDEFNEAMAGLDGMITGGGGHFDLTQDKDDGTGTAGIIPAYSGGGGGGPAEGGGNGGDFDPNTTVGQTDQGVGGQQVGMNSSDFTEEDILATGGAGGGGGGGDDDGGGDGTLADGVLGLNDDGGGGGGGGGGFFGLACAFDITLGTQDPPAGSNVETFTTSGTDDEDFTLGAPDLESVDAPSLVVTLQVPPATSGTLLVLNTDYTFDGATITLLGANTSGSTLEATYDYFNGTETERYAVIRAVGGRGGSTYAFSTSDTDPPAPADDEFNPDPSGPMGNGEAGGGGGGGGICVLAGGELDITALVTFVHGKTGGNDVNIEGGIRNVLDVGGPGGAGTWVFGDSNGVDIDQEVIDRGTVIIDPQDPAFAFPDFPPSVSDEDDRAGMTGTPALTAITYGSGPREPAFGATQIVSEFFDTLSDSVSDDEERVLSNADNLFFPYNPAGPNDTPPVPVTGRTIRVLIDTATTGAGGLPDFTAEEPDGSFSGNPSVGFTHEIDLHFDVDLNDTSPLANSEARNIITAGSQSLGKRFVRVRIIFDLAVVGSPDDLLGNPGGTADLGFAMPGAPDVVIAPGNTLGNLDTAPKGVPAVAEVRVRFTP